jgi:hypothetical protein
MLMRLETPTPAPDLAAPLSGRHDNTPLRQETRTDDWRLSGRAAPGPGATETTVKTVELERATGPYPEPD